jgi:predicted deacylase
MLKICNAIINPGEKATLALPLPEQHSYSPMYMPVKVIHGKQAGPSLLAFSVVRGDELNGMETLNKLFSLIDPLSLKGSIILVPVLNVYGLIYYPSSSPSQNSISNSFPGNKQGCYEERVAYTFTKEILKKADYCIECVTGEVNQDLLPQIYCDSGSMEEMHLAKEFQIPVVSESLKTFNQFHKTVRSLKIPLLIYKAGEGMSFCQKTIQRGIAGFKNVLAKLNMIDAVKHSTINQVFLRENKWIYSPCPGILRPNITLGDYVKKGDVLGGVTDLFINENPTLIKSKIEGVIVGINKSPLISEGQAAFKINSIVNNEVRSVENLSIEQHETS